MHRAHSSAGSVCQSLVGRGPAAGNGRGPPMAGASRSPAQRATAASRSAYSAGEMAVLSERRSVWRAGPDTHAARVADNGVHHTSSLMPTTGPQIPGTNSGEKVSASTGGPTKWRLWRGRRMNVRAGLRGTAASRAAAPASVMSQLRRSSTARWRAWGSAAARHFG